MMDNPVKLTVSFCSGAAGVLTAGSRAGTGAGAGAGAIPDLVFSIASEVRIAWGRRRRRGSSQKAVSSWAALMLD